jgi:adenylate kinase family enzyme
LKNIYYIGGSPCSGKSTVAQAIAHKFNLTYFKVDDFLNEYTIRGAKHGKPICIKQKNMTPEQTWMRDPEIQNFEELQFYNEIFEFIIKDINNISNQNGIINRRGSISSMLN